MDHGSNDVKFDISQDSLAFVAWWEKNGETQDQIKIQWFHFVSR